jgi:hypothetical protein
MSTSADKSRFRHTVDDGDAIEIPMNGLDSVIFSDKPGIGTDRLGSCSVVLIVSPSAAIMGHVSPLPDNINHDNPNAGSEHVTSFMAQVTDLYQQYQKSFGDSSSWVVCAVYQGEIALPEQQAIMKKSLINVGLKVDASQTYIVPFSPDFPDRGSVFIDGRGDTVRVYVEDRLVHSVSRPQPSQPAAVTDAPQSSSAASQQSATGYQPPASGQSTESLGKWVWSAEYQKYYWEDSNGKFWKWQE